MHFVVPFQLAFRNDGLGLEDALAKKKIFVSEGGELFIVLFFDVR
jgi:hypothetical protein